MARNAFFANKHEHLPDLTINIDARFDSTMIGCFGPDNKKIAKALSFFSDKKIDKVIFEYCDPIARTVTELYNFDFYSLLTENFKVVIYTDKLIFGNGIRALRYVTKEFYDKYAKEDDFSDSEICSCSYKETALTGLEGKEELQVDVTSIMRKAWGGKFQFAANPEQFFSSYVDLTGLPKITFKDEKSCDEFSRFFSTSSRKSKKSDLFQLNLTTREDEDTFCKLVIRESLPFG
jgi:hypothetical protein